MSNIWDSHESYGKEKPTKYISKGEIKEPGITLEVDSPTTEKRYLPLAEVRGMVKEENANKC
jgi:hypothetical protein